MWDHIEEHALGSEVTDSTGTRIWHHTTVRDISGSVAMANPERCALQLAQCDSMAAPMNAHSTGGLNMPILCHAHVSGSIRGSDGATQSAQCVSHTLQAVEGMPPSSTNTSRTLQAAPSDASVSYSGMHRRSSASQPP